MLEQSEASSCSPCGAASGRAAPGGAGGCGGKAAAAPEPGPLPCQYPAAGLSEFWTGLQSTADARPPAALAEVEGEPAQAVCFASAMRWQAGPGTSLQLHVLYSFAPPAVMACVIMLVPIRDWRNSACRLMPLPRWLQIAGIGNAEGSGGHQRLKSMSGVIPCTPSPHSCQLTPILLT